MNTVDSVVKMKYRNSQTNNTINYETTETVETEHTSISEIENNNIKKMKIKKFPYGRNYRS